MCLNSLPNNKNFIADNFQHVSLACVTDYLSQQFYGLQPKNGECRFLSQPDEPETDDQGYISSVYTARTAGFLLCSWMPKRADEQTIADKTKAQAVYELTVAQNIEGTAVVVLPSDRVELHTKIGDSSSLVTLEIVSRVNQMGAAWLIYAVDLNEGA